jgi:transcriptional regulator with XRE-family HTH domain
MTDAARRRRPSEPDPERDARLRDAAVLCRSRREELGYSLRALGRAARVGERTIRRIEAAEAVDLDSYDRVGAFFGLPRRWFLEPETVTDPADLYRSRQAAVERSLYWATDSGLLGPEARDHLRRVFEYARQHGGPHGRLESLAFAFSRDLNLPPVARPARRGR